MKTVTTVAAAALLLTLSACESDGLNTQESTADDPPSNPSTDNPPDDVTPGETPPDPDPDPQPGESVPPTTAIGITIDPPTYRNNSVFVQDDSDIGDYNDFYSQDGYGSVDVVRIDVRIPNQTQGICTIDDQSGCTLDDVLADIDGNDDFKVEIPIHASGADLPDDGSVTNATLRQRGNTARFGPQKSFRLKLDSKEVLWRNERRLQLNKNPFESTRLKNKLAFDLFQQVPHFPSLRTQFVNLWIDNGEGPEDYGMFTHTEFVGKEYVVNRGLREDDNLYKIEFFEFSEGDLNRLLVDDEGEPLDEDEFETRLEIENGKDHRPVVKMMRAMLDPARSFDSVLDEHFNRNNVLTWLATNLILRQADAITHNFYLYNPAGTERFYFLPWDYDGTFEPEPELINSFDNEQLQKRKFYGYARGINSHFVDRYYRQPGAHELLLKAIDELRANYYTDEEILERTTTLSAAVKPFLTSLPDSQHGSFGERTPERLVSVINQNYNDIVNNYDIPMEPSILKDPEIDESGVLQLEWEPAFDVTRRNTITYDLIISSSPFFEADNTVFSDEGIADVPDGLVTYPVNTANLPSGRVYVRLIARGSTDPQRVWQTNKNVLRRDNDPDLYGMLAVDLPATAPQPATPAPDPAPATPAPDPEPTPAPDPDPEPAPALTPPPAPGT